MNISASDNNYNTASFFNNQFNDQLYTYKKDLYDKDGMEENNKRKCKRNVLFRMHF